ncbi:MAG: hypothetical protein ACKVI3_05230 [Verrucomicrobiia bacterium]
MTLASAPSDAMLSPSEPMEETSDHDLMLAVRAGELGRLGDLFERHHRQLYGFLARSIGQPRRRRRPRADRLPTDPQIPPHLP